ncbi:hypothetical protein ONS95_003257 [Cadophora gregata]|uniref:uncharacterized protein n=1 Tax=Cadophora gregata TaxID=51156 RepID=UPI0026DC52FB|nr:uncharacterized protein ONS95_003257 [Cadophora gregata]KAK0108455.1 hypothetical protein ONS95_003257 [Cadophora gregata]
MPLIRTQSTSTSATPIITHRGPWDSHSRQYQTLRFIERYLDTLDASKLKSTPCTTFFSPKAVFHDTKGDVYLSGSHIWEWMKRLFAPFESVTHEIVEVRVIPEAEGHAVVYGELVRHFRMKGDRTDIVSPMFCVITIGQAEGEGGIDGMQIHEASVFWDTGILSRHVKSKEEEQKRRR